MIYDHVPTIPETQLAILGVFTPQTLAILLIFLKLGHWGDLLKSENMFASIAHSLEHGNSAISCDSKVPQCGAPKIAKLVYNSNNYGLWNL